MLKVSQIENIKDLWCNGSSIAAIKEITKVDRKTIKKYIEMEDFSKDIESYAKEASPSKLDPYKPMIDQLLEKEREYSQKQRFTATRMHEYLVKEYGATELEHYGGPQCLDTNGVFLRFEKDCFRLPEPYPLFQSIPCWESILPTKHVA